MTHMASLFLIVLSTLIHDTLSTPTNIHSVLHKWTPLTLNIKFFSPSSSIPQHIQSDIKYTLRNLTKSIQIHPLHHQQYNLPIPSHCQYLIHLNKGIETSISLHESEIIIYIISNHNDIQCPINNKSNPFHSEMCISSNDRLLFGIINLCDNINDQYITHIKYNLYKLFNNNITNLSFNPYIYSIQPTLQNHRQLLSKSANSMGELSPHDKTEILSDINMFRSQGALGKIQLGTSLIKIMQSSRMEAYIWDDALMDSAMSKAYTCNLNIPSLNSTLSNQYINNPSRIPIVDPNMTFVGEIVYNATQSINFNDAIDEALDGWREDCKHLHYFTNGCSPSAPSIQNCDNCRRLLAETARYIGCGFDKCSQESIAVVCHIYYSTNINNLAFPSPGFVPYFSPTPGGGDQCKNCPNDRNNSCDPNEGLCRGCPSLNYEACQYANNGVGPFCPPMPPDPNCAETGITTSIPTVSPTLAPTFTPTNSIGVLDIADLLNNVINLKRSWVAKGQVIHFPNSKVGVRATNMEKLIWDESLSITATNISLQCDNLYTDISTLGKLYKDTLDSMGLNARVIVSEDSENILVGETIHIVEDWTDANDAALQAFNAWQSECDLFNFAQNCDGDDSDATLCRNCLQLIWSKSRYIGCGLTGCPTIDGNNGVVYNAILFVCHWYWGADLFGFSPNTNWLLPYNPSGSDDFCMDLPFSIAGCNDTERNSCDDGLCDGCPHDNFHQCTKIIAFNQQQFGDEGCQLEPIKTTCSDGVTPTFAPTTAPIFTEPDLETVLGIANAYRSQVGSNNGVPLPASNMQSFIWHEPLAQSAFCTANTCDITPTNQNELIRRFQDTTTLDVSNDVNKIIIGELGFISTGWINPETSLIEALTYWFKQCEINDFIFGSGCCGGDCSIFDCSACLQMIWAQTRYIGCSYDSCQSIIDENGIQQNNALYVVCHFYFGANITETNGLKPYQVGRACSNCPVDRNTCDANSHLPMKKNTCTGCPANNWELCEISEPNTCNVSVPVPQNCTESGIPSPQHPEYTECPSLSPTLIPTISPTLSPTYSPTNNPTYSPTYKPTNNPSISPINKPTQSPINSPTSNPTMSPTDTPTKNPTIAPTTKPTISPTNIPSTSPIRKPTYNPTISPTNNPTISPSTNPTPSPTINPTDNPSNIPSISPTSNTNTPSISPSKIPTNTPTINPSITPTFSPSITPTNSPIKSPTNYPTMSPSRKPSFLPSISPSLQPTNKPSISPSITPTNLPTQLPTNNPSISPSKTPSLQPTTHPTNIPSIPPTISPSLDPSNPPTNAPSFSPSNTPTHSPNFIPTTSYPSINPTNIPSIQPTTNTLSPTIMPSITPSNTPTIKPTNTPTTITNPPSTFTSTPTISPSKNPIISPTHSPTTITPTISSSINPSEYPSQLPTTIPTKSPSEPPTITPSISPTTITPTISPSINPTENPSKLPTEIPTNLPTIIPSELPTITPSIISTTIPPSPSYTPNPPSTLVPTISPSIKPTENPSKLPTQNPSTITPTEIPSKLPTEIPTNLPTITPSKLPTEIPANLPTTIPTQLPIITPSISPTTIQPSPSYTPEPSSTVIPTMSPSINPTENPSKLPTKIPSQLPTTIAPSPTMYPTTSPTDSPTSALTVFPTDSPTSTTDQPTPSPTSSPTTFPVETPTTTPVKTTPTWPTNAPTRPTSGWIRRPYTSRHHKTHDFLVAVDVCFSADNNYNSQYPSYGSFIIPYSGSIHGITLTYSSGGIYENAQAVKTNWGINEMINLFCIHITNDKSQILYPNHHTNGYNPHCDNITNIPQYLPFGHYIKDDTMYCLNEQSITNYKLHFVDTNHKKLVHVNAGDVLRIYWNDMLFKNEKDFNNELNGKLCVDVMVYYHHVYDDAHSKRHKSSDTDVYKKTTIKPTLYSSSSDHKFYKKNKKYSPKKFHWYWMQRYQSS